MGMTNNSPDRRGLKDYLGLALRGFCMGAADVVPGVSGGTMAFILGIYEELLQAIHSIDLGLLRHLLALRFREAFDRLPWRFLLVLGIGIGTAFLTLARGLSWALHQHPVLIWSFFFGLVLASVITVRKSVKRWTPAVLLTALLAAGAAYLLVGMVPMQTPDEPWFLFFSGALAVSAMILPGLSGAFILVILGKYHYLLNAVVQGNLVPLIFVAAGAAIGLISFARVLRWLFRSYHDLTVAALMGLMLGALRKVWPWKRGAVEDGELGGELALLQEVNVLPAAADAELALAVGLASLGFGLVLALDYLARGRPSRSTPSVS